MINVIDFIKTISRLIYASIVFRESCLQKIDVCYTCHINNHEQYNPTFSLIYKYKFGSCFTPLEYYEVLSFVKENLGCDIPLDLYSLRRILSLTYTQQSNWRTRAN